jgi:RNA polymerase sigma factor (sigma-70 family)
VLFCEHLLVLDRKAEPVAHVVGDPRMIEQKAAETINSLYESWYAPLVRYAYRATDNFELAEDLVQNCFIELYQALLRGKDIQNVRGWTLCVLRRSINRQRSEHVFHESLEQLESFECAAPIASSHHDVIEMFSVLAKREEEVLLLRMQTMKYLEIAEQLGISVNSVNTLIARALRKLRLARRQGARASDSERPLNYAETTGTLH